jgi:periplasmic copper chaperone A
MKRLAVVLATALAALLAALALAGPASAHVTVTAPGAVAGGSDQEITFRVPVETDVATTAVTVSLPTDTPIASVEVQAIPGWTHTQKTTKLATPIKTDDGDITEAVSQITWTAGAGNGLKPGEFGAFTIIAGQLPDATSLKFAAIQTYANGSVVKWIQVAAPGSTVEPENPAPILTLGKPGTGTSTATKSAKAPSNTGPVVLSIIALVVAAGALGYAFVTRARSRT